MHMAIIYKYRDIYNAWQNKMELCIMQPGQRRILMLTLRAATVSRWVGARIANLGYSACLEKQIGQSNNLKPKAGSSVHLKEKQGDPKKQLNRKHSPDDVSAQLFVLRPQIL